MKLTMPHVGAPSLVRGKANNFTITVDNRGTDNQELMAKFASNLEKKNHTGRKRPTMAMRLGFLIENFFRKIIFSGLIFLLAFPHTELGETVPMHEELL